MLNLGAEQTPPLVDRIPKIKILDENNIRKGFFEYNQFLRVREQLPEYLVGFVTIAYNKGWRLDEIETLAWEMVARRLGIICLEPGDTKTMRPELPTSIKRKRRLTPNNGSSFAKIC